MLRHHLLLAYRNFLAFKTTFLINLIGLSTGLACTFLIFLWIQGERSVDSFHVKGDRLFQVMENIPNASGIITRPEMPIGLAPVIAETIPEVEHAATVTPFGWFPKFVLEGKNGHLKCEGKFVGSDFFRIFSYKLIIGNDHEVLGEKYNVVLSRKLACALFGSPSDALGRTLHWQLSDIQKDCKVTGVFDDVPANSSDAFDLVLPIGLLGDIMGFDANGLGGPGPWTYLTLKRGADVIQFNEKVTRMMATRNGYETSSFFATPYSQKYLHGRFENGVPAGGRVEYLNLFALIALVVILLACVNYMNLSTAKASFRIKEIGIRKTMGAFRKTLVVQYLIESTVIAFLSMLIALLMVPLVLPWFTDITGKQVTTQLNFTNCGILAGITLLTGIIAGSYPALYLSGFNPAAVLKGKLTTPASGLFIRNGLVVLQFATSIVFIVSVTVIEGQIEYIGSRPLGYDKENVIHFELEGKAGGNQYDLLSRVKAIPGVVQASAMVGNIVGGYGPPHEIEFDGKRIPFNSLMIDYGMIETMGMKMISGRAFSPEFADTARIVFNQTAIGAMGIIDPIGKLISFRGQQVEIIGVVQDFHSGSLHEKINPFFFQLETRQLLNIFVRLQKGKETEALLALELMYKNYNPGYSLDYQFLDQDFQKQFTSERRLSGLASVFAGLTIVISCLGLFALAAFTAARRVKEIGIRKVLGSTSVGIVVLLSVDFVKLVLLSIIISLPVSYFLTKEWLSGYAYAVKLTPWYFVGASMAALLIALLTVSGHAIRASLVNPSDCLRNE